MTVPQVKGWCPGALRPMVSGDGLILRIRPRLAQITVGQAHGIADLAAVHGNGFIQLTNRANLQIRGVTDAGLPELTKGLAAFGLLDDTPEAEAARNIIVSPLWSDTATPVIANALADALTGATMPNLPGKFGFAVDTAGPVTFLSAISADIRIETAGEALIVRADGAAHGRRVASTEQAVALAIALARWFAASGGVDAGGRGRMRAHLARGAVIPPHLAGDTAPNPVADPFQPGLYNGASCIAFAFGQIPAATLHLLTDAARSPIRLTPWHALAFMGQDLAHTVANHPDLIATPNDPLLRVTACTGAPGCPQAHAETRSLARSLAVHVPDGSHLHVSGCAKGCAHPGPAPVTLTATPNGFSLVRNRRAGDTPDLTGLGADMLRTSPDLFRALP